MGDVGETVDDAQGIVSHTIDDRASGPSASLESRPSGSSGAIIPLSALDSIGVSVAILDENGSVLASNRRLRESLACDAEELKGRHLLDFSASGIDAKDRALFRRILRGERSGLLIERRLQTRSGKTLWGRITLSTMPADEGAHRTLATIEDVTVRHEVERRLQELESLGRGQHRELLRRLAMEAATREEAEDARKMVESILETITDSFIAIDSDWEILYLNHRAVSQMGKTKEEAIGRSLWMVFPEMVGTVIHRNLFQVRNGRQPTEFELFVPDSSRWFEVRAFPSQRMICVYFRDITERRRTSERERSLAAVFDLTPDFVGIADAEGQLLYINSAGRELTGFDPEEDISGHNLFALHPPEAARIALEEGVPAALRDGVWIGEGSAIRGDGVQVPVSEVLLAQRNEEGELQSFATIWRDISETKAEEERKLFLNEASKHLTASLDLEDLLHRLPRLAIPVLGDFCTLVMREEDQSYQVAEAHVDPAGQELLVDLRNYREVAPTVVGVGQVLASGEPELVPEVTGAWIRTASHDREHYRILTALGIRSLVIVPLAARGRILGAVACGYSSSAQRHDQGHLDLALRLADIAAFALDNARLYREAQTSTHLRDEVLGIVSHDLRSPLAVISIAAERLLRRTQEKSCEAERKKLQVIRDAAQRANRLVEDLLDVARLQGKKLMVTPVPSSPASMVSEAVQTWAEPAKEKQIRIESSVDPGLPEVLADPERTPQVFANLIGNAIKFIPSGGRIALRASKQDGAVRFSVTDDGPGIEPAMLPHIFDAFWQVRQGKRGSSGLGLAIVKGIVSAHRGEVTVDSTPGQGSTFTFTLPVATSAASA